MSSKNKREIKQFFDAAIGWSDDCLTSIKNRLNLDDAVQAAKANVIDDIFLIRTINY